jgi:hypothetical protein
MCLASRPAPPPPMPQMPPPPPAPPMPPPSPVQVEGAGQRVATIQSKASTRSAKDRSRGAASFSAPGRRVMQTIQGQTTGLNVPQ